MTPFAEWLNFYVIVGSAAGALTGLQFIVMVLIADMPIRGDEVSTSYAFATPTIVHFVGVLLLACSMAMPWHSLTPAVVVWTASGLAGVGYTLLVARRMQTQTSYKPVLEDWLFHTVFPLAAYAGFAVAALTLPNGPWPSLFAIAAASLLLLCVAIHNAWDNVTYLVHLRRERLDEPNTR